MSKLKCYQCTKEISLQVCGRCRETSKHFLVKMLKAEKIYLTEVNRNKKGFTKKLTATQQHDLAYAHKCGESFRTLAEKYGVSPSTALRAYRREYDIRGGK